MGDGNEATARERPRDVRPAHDAPDAAPGARHVVVCLDGSEIGERVIPHALPIAHALGARLTLLRVLEQPREHTGLPDPIEWDLGRREASEHLEHLSRRHAKDGEPLGTTLIEGVPAERICRWVRDHEVDVTALCRHGTRGPSRWSLASTARKLVDQLPSSFLLVPADGPPAEPTVHYRRILVPLDGSPRAESALSLAVRLAAAERAELILAHVVPVPELTEIGPLDREDLELRARLVERNERVATDYLAKLRARLADTDAAARVVVTRGEDVRTELLRIVADEGADLVVLSTHGQTGCAELACGNVADFLTAQVAAPLLIVRAVPPPRPAGPSEQDATTRLPGKAGP